MHDPIDALLEKLEAEYLLRLQAYALEDYDYFTTLQARIANPAQSKHDDGAAG